jgi:hypothetical protein
MSFDLKIEEGDLKITNGELATVENSEKLVQDILKILTTDLGANLFFPWYGCPITKSLIGTGYGSTFVKDVATQQLFTSLQTLQRMQDDQLQRSQIVTPQEQIAAIQNVDVNRNPSDPRFFTVAVTVLSKSFRRVEVPVFAVNL